MRASKRKNEVFLTPGTVPESKKTVSPAKDERFWCPNDTLSPSSPVLSQINPPVATTSGQKSVNVCPSPQIALPLPLQTSNNACHCKTRSLTIRIYKIMTQKNEMSARALSMEELENVNGGKVTIQDILKSTTAILMFP